MESQLKVDYLSGMLEYLKNLLELTLRLNLAKRDQGNVEYISESIELI